MSRQNLKLFSMNFIRCGIAGWCLEVVFTALDSLARGNWKMMGQTSLIMFPIYGLGALLSPMGRLVDWWVDGPEENPGVRTTGSKPVARYIRHGLLYMVLIFLMEYLSGRWLSRSRCSGGSNKPYTIRITKIGKSIVIGNGRKVIWQATDHFL